MSGSKSHKTKPWRHRWTVALAGTAVSLVGLGVVWLAVEQARPAYRGPVEQISTGLIGEYAALVLIAQNQGYFKDEGLEVTIKEYPSGPAALADLLAGKLDTAMGSDFAGVRNSFAGEDLRILATMSKAEAFDLIARRDRGITEVTDLKGKRVGVTRKTVGEFYLGQFLMFNGLQQSDVQIVDLPQENLVEALKQGQIEAAVLFEPNAYQAKAQLGAEAVRWSVQGDQSIYSLLYATSKLTTQRPEAIKRYLRATLRAERFVAEHDAEARTLIARRLNYDDDYITYIWPKFRFVVSLDHELLLNMNDEARWAAEHKLTARPELPDYLQLMYLPALEAIKPERVTIKH